jgi:hypothetical protein
MKNKLKVLSIIAFVAVFTLSAATCFIQSGGGGKNLNSPEALKEYLDGQPVNSPDKPIKVSMTINDLMLKSVADVIKSAGKYVNLTISGNALTTIEGLAFEECKTLVGITIPNSVTNIGMFSFQYCSLTSITIPNSVTIIEEYAFRGCISLTSVTFQGNTDFSARFKHDDDYIYSFMGDLQKKYLAGGIGTYTTSTPLPEEKWRWNPVWTKK